MGPSLSKVREGTGSRPAIWAPAGFWEGDDRSSVLPSYSRKFLFGAASTPSETGSWQFLGLETVPGSKSNLTPGSQSRPTPSVFSPHPEMASQPPSPLQPPCRFPGACPEPWTPSQAPGDRAAPVSPSAPHLHLHTGEKPGPEGPSSPETKWMPSTTLPGPDPALPTMACLRPFQLDGVHHAWQTAHPSPSPREQRLSPLGGTSEQLC